MRLTIARILCFVTLLFVAGYGATHDTAQSTRPNSIQKFDRPNVLYIGFISPVVVAEAVVDVLVSGNWAGLTLFGYEREISPGNKFSARLRYFQGIKTNDTTLVYNYKEYEGLGFAVDYKKNLSNNLFAGAALNAAFLSSGYFNENGNFFSSLEDTRPVTVLMPSILLGAVIPGAHRFRNLYQLEIGYPLSPIEFNHSKAMTLGTIYGLETGLYVKLEVLLGLAF